MDLVKAQFNINKTGSAGNSFMNELKDLVNYINGEVQKMYSVNNHLESK